MPRLIAVVCTVACITLLCSHSIWAFSLPNKPRNHQPGRCRQVRDIDVGAPDIQVLPNGLALITSGTTAKGRGNIFLFDFKKRTHGADALDIVGDFDRVTFSPHCLSIWRDTNRNLIYIFVVNHLGNDTDTVEKFRFDEKRRTLYHVRTYQDPSFTHLIDTVATGEDSFYFVNFYEFDWALEFIFDIRVGTVGFYDGKRGRIVLKELRSPLGINASPDGNNLYGTTRAPPHLNFLKCRICDPMTVAKTQAVGYLCHSSTARYVYLAEFGGRLIVYRRKSDNTLRLKQVVPMCGLIDLIDVDVATGDLWVGGHGDAYLALKYMLPPHTSISPSLVFRLTMAHGGSTVVDVEEVYYNDGRQISGASIAAHYGRHMLIGSVYTKMVLCQV